MKSNYFNSPVIIPLVKASAQHATFAGGDIVFDWTRVDLPRGASRVLGATISFRHNKVATQTAGIDLVFARDEGTNVQPTTIGIGNAVLGVTNYAESAVDIMGVLIGDRTNDFANLAATAMSVSTSTAMGGNYIILDPKKGVGSPMVGPATAGNPNGNSKTQSPSHGVESFWVAGIANGGLDMRSLVAADAAITIAGENGTLTDLDGTAPNLVFAAGDVIHMEDDIIVGELAEVTTNNMAFKFAGETSANHSGTYIVPPSIAQWRIQNGAGAAGDIAEDEVFYNVFPLRITLHCTK